MEDTVVLKETCHVSSLMHSANSYKSEKGEGGERERERKWVTIKEKLL